MINRSDAEDATQNALISIVKALPSFDGRSQFSTWVYRIATNAALDEVRRIGRRPRPTDNDAVYDSAQNDRTEAVAAQLDVVSALAEIPEEYRTTLVLRHVADLEYEEIAAIQGIAIGTVRSRLARGRAQLVEILGNQEAPSNRQTDSNSAHERGPHEQ
ncbi:MAG: hypothetical protein RLY19_204 [Actinomycetota bacterium]